MNSLETVDYKRFRLTMESFETIVYSILEIIEAAGMM